LRPDGAPTFNWHESPFLFQAFKLAVREVLDGLQCPSGETKSPLNGQDPAALRGLPSQIMESFSTPETRACATAMIVLNMLYTYEPPNTQLHEAAKQHEWARQAADEHYAMSNARRDLKIDPSKPAPFVPTWTADRSGVK
jgi:hypothetical protein